MIGTIGRMTIIVILMGMLTAKVFAYDDSSFPEIVKLNVYPETITIDGKLDEVVWQSLPIFANLQSAIAGTQSDSDNNPTEVKAFIDNQDNIYFGFKCKETHLDSDGEGIDTDGPFIANLNHTYPTSGYQSPIETSDFVRVRLAFGRWGRYAYYLFDSTVDPVCPPWYGAYGQSYFAYESSASDYGKAVTVGKHLGASGFSYFQPVPLYQSKSYIPSLWVANGYWTAEIKIGLKDLLLYPADGIPKYMEVEFFRVRLGEDRGQMRGTTDYGSSCPGCFTQYGGALWKNFHNYVQSWTHMDAPQRFYRRFEDYTDYRDAINPLWFQLVRLGNGQVENKLVQRLDALHIAHNDVYTNMYTQEEKNKLRIECWEDTTPVRPAWKSDPPLIQTVPLEYSEADFTQLPRVTTTAEGALISFSVKENIDVAVAIINSDGKIIRHLASGVLGKNPPLPFKPDSLYQDILWDWKDDFGNIVFPANYTVKVYIGLTPKYCFSFPETPYDPDMAAHILGIEQSPSSIDVGLETIPEPGDPYYFIRDHMGSETNTLYVDSATEEVYLGGFYIHDGNTGQFLRNLIFCEALPSGVGSRLMPPEIVVGSDNNLWVAGWNELRRYDRNGNIAAWDLLRSHVHPQIRRGHVNPNRGHSFGGPDNDCYILHHYNPHGNIEGVISRIGVDGRMKQWGIVEVSTQTQCVKVDRQGYIYTSFPLYADKQLIPVDFAPAISQEQIDYFRYFYGAVVKFLPQGGKLITGDKDSRYMFPWWAHGDAYARLLGVEWVHPWMSPVITRQRCCCEGSRFDLDPFERLWIPDAVRSRIEITDKNANTIAFIGRYGRLEDNIEGQEHDINFGYPKVISVSDRGCYIGDFYNRKVVKLDITDFAYKQVAAADIEAFTDFAIITPGELLPVPEGSKDVSIQLEVINGNPAYSWQITGGALPEGLLLDQYSGKITGMTNDVGTYVFSVTITDGNGQTYTKEFSLDVVTPAPLAIVTDTIYSATLNSDSPYGFQLAAEGGIPPYRWALKSGSLPVGLVLDEGMGYIYGTATVLGIATFEIEVYDSSLPNSEFCSKQFSLMVKQGGAADYIAPAAIKDLSATKLSSTFLMLSWTATGDDEIYGYALKSDLRYSTTELLESANLLERNTWWDQATRVLGLPKPQACGKPEQFTVDNLTADTTYYFVIRAIDKGENLSDMSNICIVKTAPLPEQVTAKICVDCSKENGLCYTSLSQWQAAYGGIDYGSHVKGDLVAVNKIAVAQCYNEWPQGLDEKNGVTIDGWTADKDHYIKIIAAPGHATNGKSGSGFKVKSTWRYYGTLFVKAPYTKIQGIEIENTPAKPYEGVSASALTAFPSAAYLEIDGCLLTSNFKNPTLSQNNAPYMKVWNTIIRQTDNSGPCLQLAEYTQSAYIYNVTLVNGSVGIGGGNTKGDTNIAIIKNCVAYNNTIDFNCSFHPDSTNNASADTTAIGQNPQTGAGSLDFVDALAGDYHIAEMSVKLKNKGVDLSSDTYIAFITDILGVSRNQQKAWDIGAYEFIPVFMAGDINGDGEVNILDLQLCVNVVLGIETAPDIVLRANVNGDEGTDVLDVQAMVNKILGG